MGNLIRDVTERMDKPPKKIIPDAIKLSSATCDHVIRSYIQPAWHERKTKGDIESAGHYARLADNVRQASAGSKLPKSNAHEIIYTWLSPAWLKAEREGRQSSHFHRMATELRESAGIPAETHD